MTRAFKRLVAGYAGTPFGHEYAVLVDKANEEPFSTPTSHEGGLDEHDAYEIASDLSD